MNQSDLSEAFGQQMEALTTGTRYEIDSESDEAMNNAEGRMRGVMYNLWMDAQSKELANTLKSEQDAHFAELYEFSYGVTSYDIYDTPMVKGTENLALMIIDEKRAFEKRIKRMYKRYERFRKLTRELEPSSRRIIVGYFEHGHKVDYELLRATLNKNIKEIERVYNDEEKSQEEEADRLEDEYQAQLGNEKYLIDRKYVYMKPDEYTAYKEKQKAKRNEIYERLGLSM